jgi:hypothetical protein
MIRLKSARAASARDARQQEREICRAEYLFAISVLWQCLPDGTSGRLFAGGVIARLGGVCNLVLRDIWTDKSIRAVFEALH